MNYETGASNGFFWFESHLLSIDDLIDKLPNLFLRKFLVICRFDGGVFEPNIEELKKGWKQIDELTYTEFITSNTLKNPIYDNYDQWLLTENHTRIDRINDFVNYVYFSLIDWSLKVNELSDPEDIKFIQEYADPRTKLRALFWEQIGPVNFISEGSKLIFVSKSKAEIELIENTIANNL